jgi:hypothetical protein
VYNDFRIGGMPGGEGGCETPTPRLEWVENPEIFSGNNLGNKCLLSHLGMDYYI